MKGMEVLRRKAEGPEATLDLSHATAGSYTMMILTTDASRYVYKIIRK